MKSVNAQRLRLYYNALCTLQSASVLLAEVWAQISKSFTKGNVSNNKALREYHEAYTDFVAKVSALENETAASLSQTVGDWLVALSSILSRWNNSISHLRSKVGYNVVRKQVFDSGLNVIVELFESGNAEQNDITKAYLKSVYKQCANYYISNDKELSFFQSILFEDKIKRFRKLCHEFEELTRR